LAYWNEHGYQSRWVMLSSKHETGQPADPETLKKLSPHFELLRQMIERRFGYKGVEFVKVLTAEGGGVVHCILAWRGPRLFYIPQRWLSAAWKRIHGAQYVWITEIKTGKASRKNLSKYLVSQYVASQDDFIRCDYSYRKTFGFPLLRVWKEFKRFFPVKFRFALWHQVMAGAEVTSSGGLAWSVEGVRENYVAFRELEKRRRLERAEQVKASRERQRGHGLEYGRVTKALEDAYAFVCAGKTWRDAAGVA
jgi:hypothetical protein